LTSRPPVFTNRGCKLVSDHFSILAGNARPRAPRPQIPQVAGDQAQHQAHFVRAEPMATQPRHRHGLLAFWSSTLATTRRAVFQLAAR
jgi:hypothetical protein